MPNLKQEQLICPVNPGHLSLKVLGLDDREPAGSWDLAGEGKAAHSQCVYSNPEGTALLACEEGQCRWLNIQLSSREGSDFPAMTYNSSQEWELRSSCGSLRVIVSIEALAAGP